MTLIPKTLTASFLAIALGVGPVWAQAGLSTAIDSVVATCAGGGACGAAIQGYISLAEEQGLTGTAFDDALADLIVELAQTAQDLPAPLRASIAAEIRAAATEFIDPDRGAAVVAIADAVALGQPVETAALVEEASPG